MSKVPKIQKPKETSRKHEMERTRRNAMRFVSSEIKNRQAKIENRKH
jgi:hypothetical protein